ncbi:hypothetical protein PISMIDRAFT_115344 [Pisolithus microcarpus 441]|uniref:Retrovirus-related Pol polyprotein from transposon TNT 1-94-like beta-barrel domain-containing protein n=1 Tax=Pisolithus microcarpus 441 TaxID=765257 RepID=A0A0C9Z5T1_9AGAM|nr:hypothetical protein PISMIDRAFT_115344 [Pisolithus microcarpus 441]
MGKFENVPELRGTENYYEWRRQTEHGTNPFDYVKYASTCPRPLIPAAPTVTEQEGIRAWFKDDGVAKLIVLRKINSSVLTLIPDDVSITAREVWTTLAELYDRSDVSLQFSLCTHISTLQMKDAADAERYVASHVHANDRLARMGARPSDEDAIYALLRGLPRTGIWPVIRKNIETELERSEQLARTFAPGSFSAIPMTTYTFKHAAQTIVKEAMQIVNESPKPRPGSEYASSALPGGRGEVNPATGLRKTKNNPSGTPCTTPICVGRKRVDHDWNNCFQVGGGKAGQAPWQKSKGAGQGNTQVAAVATTTPAMADVTPQPTGTQTNVQVAVAAIPCPPTDGYFRDLSCAMIEEVGGDLASLAATVSSTILDSGTTTHLIRDSSFFWTFTRDSTVSMKTANQGSLGTEGYGDCVAILKLGDRRIRLRLEHCLYAPNAVVNLLSVGRMTERGWELRFKGGPSWCEMYHANEPLGSVDMRGQLCFLDVEFICPPNSPDSVITPGFTAFTPSALTWDLWHA